MRLLNCDGCGRTMHKEGEERVFHYRLLVIDPSRTGTFLFPTPMEGQDFCSLGCVGTWAIQQETAQR